MNSDDARKILMQVMEKEFSDKTFSHYIQEKLAGDFAVEIATLLTERREKHERKSE